MIHIDKSGRGELFMILRYPAYYEQFICIADQCEDTCCAGWEIDIDDESYQYYMSIKGAFGERLRRSVKEYQPEDEDVYEQHGFILREDKRCPFLDEKGLCDLYKELGEDALCDVCTDTPRNFLEYGGAREIALSAACGEVGRLIYAKEDKIVFVERETKGELDWKESKEEMALAGRIRIARDRAIQILQNRELTLERRILLYLSYAEEIQGYLNENASERIEGMEWQKYMQELPEALGREGQRDDGGEAYKMFLRRMVTFTALDSVSVEWEEMLRLLGHYFVDSQDGPWFYREALHSLRREVTGQHREYEYEHLMVYYVFLCQARCVDDYDFIGRAVLAVVSFLMIRDMDAVKFYVKGSFEKADRVDHARIYAREVEHSEDNMEYLAEEFLFEEIYKPEYLRKAFLHP